MGTDQYGAQTVALCELLPWTLEEANGSVPARFERVVRAYPEATAVKSGERRVSYGELNMAANRIAHALLLRLGESNVPVASLLSDRVRVIEALMGVLKAGKIHTPLAPDQPARRLLQILDDADPPLVLVDAAHRALAAQLGLPPERLLELDALDPQLPTHDPCLSVSPESYAYIIYTSGSTGRPKGVVHKHRIVIGRVQRWQVSWGVCVGARILLMSSPGHTSALASILTSLLYGATICPYVLEKEGLANLRDFLLRERVTRISGTASTFRHFMGTLQPADRFPDIKYVAFHGEAVRRKDFELFKQHFGPDALLRTGLGSTEAAILTELFLDRQSVVTERIVPAGYPIIAGEVYVADEEGKCVPAGVVGEVIVKSSDLADYWRNPDLSARAFTPDPEGSGKRIFRTGDLGLLRADGMLEHHGRKDFQVKIRGNRVELGEIEMALFDLDNIREAVVVARPGADGETRLIAYVVPETMRAEPRLMQGGSPSGALPAGRRTDQDLHASGQSLTAGILRRRLAESLPAYMVPTAFVMLEALPLTANGKIDRVQLPAPDIARVEGGTARDTLERRLAHIWAELLHVPDVGPHEDFFDLGGNSLLAMRLFADLEHTLGRKLPLSFLFEASTIAELAALIRTVQAGVARESCLVPIQTGGGRRPFFLAVGGGGGDAELLVYAPLARFLSAEQPFYGLRARAVAPGRGSNDEIEAIAAGHVAEIRAVQPSGPYLLGGECIGGIVAVEIARQLRAAGQGVALLCLLDTVRPTWRTWLARCFRQTVRRATRVARNPARIPKMLALPRPAAPGRPYQKATQRYRPRRVADRITLLVNQEYHRHNPTLGWQGLAEGGIEVHALPGTHDTYIRQNAQTTGECLCDCLERAHAQGQWAERGIGLESLESVLAR